MANQDRGSSGQPSVLPTALASAGGVALGLGLGGPEGAVLGGFATPYLEHYLRRSFAAFGADARERIGQMRASARDAAGCTDDELDERLFESERTRLLNVKAILAAAGTVWPPKVVALGRVLAAGLIAEDDAAIDLQQSALAAMAEMERPHVALLDLLVHYQPHAEMGVGWKAIPPVIPSYVSQYLGGGGELVWSAGTRCWTLDQIKDVRPALASALTGVLATLRSFGLIEEKDTGPDAAKRLGEELVKQMNRPTVQNRYNLQAPVVPSIDPSWLPTERGEQVLGYYELAAQESPSDAAS